jgi:hypothetical protein
MPAAKVCRSLCAMLQRLAIPLGLGQLVAEKGRLGTADSCFNQKRPFRSPSMLFCLSVLSDFPCKASWRAKTEKGEMPLEANQRASLPIIDVITTKFETGPV